MTGAILTLYKPPSVQAWQLLFAKLLPGAHVAAIALEGCSYHRMTVNLEDAGFEIRDQIVWICERIVPIALARKPLGESTIAANVLKYGTGGINVDECRITTSGADRDKHLAEWKRKQSLSAEQGRHAMRGGLMQIDLSLYAKEGRFPANVILTRKAGARLDEQTVGASRFFKCNDTVQELVTYLRLLIIPQEVQCLDTK